MDQWVLNEPYWDAPMILSGDEAVLYRRYVNDKKQSRIYANAYWWVNSPWMWLVRVGSVLALLFYTLGGGDVIGWVIGLTVLFLVSCGSCFICMQREADAEKAISNVENSREFQDLQKRIDAYDQQQMIKNVPTQEPMSYSRVKRDNFKLTRY